MKKEIVREEHFIAPADDPAIRLHLREKRLKGKGKFSTGETLLFVHGQSVPSPACFDLPVPGYSWMDHAAGRGFDVYALSLRGYGLSSRPRAMEGCPGGRPPAVRARVAIRDVEAAVRFIRRRRGVSRVNILGWAQGTMLAAAFAGRHPAQAGKIVLYSPLYLNETPEAAALFQDPKNPKKLNPELFFAWRWVYEKGQQHNWSRLFPKGKKNLWCDARAVRAYWHEQLRYDARGKKKKTPAVRITNGLMADHYDRTQGKTIVRPGKVRSAALLIRGEHDRVSPENEVSRLFAELKNTAGKRYVVMGDATHFVQFEKRREALFGEVQNFLES
ncbi:MAG: alpha/beta fold hydrolase [bacterium]|nr:alpha/beta fold hydrolase [bacterium]